MADIVSMPGVTAPERVASAQPQPEIVERIRELLRRAETGDVQAIAYCYVNESGMPCEGNFIPEALPRNIDYTLGFAVAAMFHRFYEEQVAGARSTVPPPSEPA